MKESLIKLRIKIDHLSTRERIILLLMSLLMVFLLWSFLIYTPQQRWILQMETLARQQEDQAATLKKRQELVQTLSTDTTVIKLLERFQQLKSELKDFNAQQARYSHRYIGEQELAKLLYSMLEKTGSVSIENFATIDYDSAQGSAAGTPKSAAAPGPAAPAVINPESSAPVERVQYLLKLKGDYFPIMNYLHRLEQLKWVLYWDKIDYKVKSYPAADLDIQFYTLKPSSQVPPAIDTGTPQVSPPAASTTP